MKVKCFLFFLLLSRMLSAQTLYKATQDYFRQNPFKTEFHQFINNLISDPALSEKEIKKKTDTTLFFLQGIYKSHSPFFFPVSRCKVVLAERQEFIDTVTNHVYTYFVYQMIGYAPPGKEGLKDVKEEFERLNRRLKKGLEIIDPKELKRGDAPSGAINNYTYRNLLFYPLTIAWATTAENTENIIALTIRFFMAKNTAYLPIPSNGP